MTTKFVTTEKFIHAKKDRATPVACGYPMPPYYATFENFRNDDLMGTMPNRRCPACAMQLGVPNPSR